MERYAAVLEGPDGRDLAEAMAERAERAVQELLREHATLALAGPVDVVISGGGFRGQYAGGVLAVTAPPATRRGSAGRSVRRSMSRLICRG